MRRNKRSHIPVSRHLSVIIEQSDHAIILAKPRNICLEGMLLELDCPLPESGARVSLECTVNDICWRIEAVVIHANSHCLGLKFIQPQPELMKAATTQLTQPTQPVAGRLSLANTSAMHISKNH